MKIEDHHKEFLKIIDKYSLKDKADEIAEELTGSTTDADKFAKKHGMTKKEAVLFLDFIHKGVDFKEKHIDRK